MLEAVPNVSEGRDGGVIDEIGRAFASRAALLDVHADPDHHRSVFTLAGESSTLAESLVEGISRAVELVDLREHDGVHPRVGVADVVPVVSFVPEDQELADEVACRLAERIGAELGLPVFLYGQIGGGRRPAFFRRGGLAELERRVQTGDIRPDAGPNRLDPRVGAVLVGARAPLVAYNVDLGTDDVRVAAAIAAEIRESGGGMAGVQAIGLDLPRSGRVQVSMNVLDLVRSPLHEVIERVRRAAGSRGIAIAGGELVGLVPEHVLAAARAAGVVVPGVDESRTLEGALARSGFLDA